MKDEPKERFVADPAALDVDNSKASGEKFDMDDDDAGDQDGSDS